MTAPSIPPAPAPAGDLTPKLISTLREGYGLAALRADAVAGLTVAIVALPLSMAIAIASGVGPERGLYAAIVGGFLVSLLGGSRYQIGGPAGAFIVLVALTVQRHGVDGLLLATIMSGVMLVAAGLLRLGAYIKFVPYPVTVGFTAGIAVIIFASQIAPLFGMSLPDGEPGPLLDKLPALWAATPSINFSATVVALGSICAIVLLRQWKPHLPGMLIAVAGAAVATVVFGLDVDTVGSRFGDLPHGLPAPALPEITLARMQAVLPDAIAFTLLGAIESLLSAVVADGMTGRRHRSNPELVAQGVANVGSALFGGLVVTGTIARTATNVRAGAHGPVAGMLHAAFLLAFMVLAAGLARHIPLAALAGVLAVVAWGMAERHAFATLLRGDRGDAVVLLATFLLTIFRELSEAIVVGVALGAMLFIGRISKMTELQSDPVDAAKEERTDALARRLAADPDIAVLRVSGALFFGAVSVMDTALDRIGDEHKLMLLDMSAASLIDSTGARSIAATAAKARRQGVLFCVVGANAAVRRALLAQEVRPPEVSYAATLEDALQMWRARAA